jgi:hypothetical protein
MADPTIALTVTPGLEVLAPPHLRRRMTIVGYGELLKFTPTVRSLILEGRLRHDGSVALAEHVNRSRPTTRSSCRRRSLPARSNWLERWYGPPHWPPDRRPGRNPRSPRTDHPHFVHRLGIDSASWDSSRVGT